MPKLETRRNQVYNRVPPPPLGELDTVVVVVG